MKKILIMNFVFLVVEIMACVPFGVHAAQKVRHNMNLAKEMAKDHEKPTTYSNSSNNNYGKKWYNDLGNTYKPKTSTSKLLFANLLQNENLLNSFYIITFFL